MAESKNILGFLGICRKSGKLACGESQVSDMFLTGKCRAIFIANDIGDKTYKKIMHYDEKVPVFILDCDKITLGNAIGINGCGVCALDDIGMANSIALKIENFSSRNLQAAKRVYEKKAIIDSRKGKKKKK